jgi:PKD repeat protein
MSVSTTNDFSAVLDASTSSDSDGSVASYAWSFPDACTDGACSPTATGKTTTLTVDQPGTYTVSLTVTDNGGATSTATKTINLGQTAPTASFDQGCTALKCVFRSTSTNVPDDSAEPNVVYAWDFGDGTTDPQGAGRPGHTYAKAGTYTVTLALTVGYGTVSSTVTKSVTVTATSTNRPPVAAFTYSISPTDGQTVTFDASTSTDPDGNITYYDWYFANDCSTHACDPTASGKVTIRSFESAQLETVSLSVTDAGGLISTITKTIDLSESAALASDDFNRTVSGGFGTATAGGAWTGSNTTSELSVSPGAGKFSIVAGSTTGAYLGAVSSTNTEVTTAVSVDKLSSGGNGIYLWVIPRRVSSTALYQARVRIVGGAVKLSLSKLSGSSTETTISSEVAAGTIAAGQKLDVVVEATGSSPTTLKALAYVDGTTVPEWQVSAIDSAAGIQSSGSVGLKGYVSSGVTNGPLVASFSSFAATTPN